MSGKSSNCISCIDPGCTEIVPGGFCRGFALRGWFGTSALRLSSGSKNKRSPYDYDYENDCDYEVA